MADPFQDRTAENHPSFVTVQFSRLSGSKRFFGSSVTSHSWIRLQIRPATLYHHLGEDNIGEAATRVASQAKAEVDAFITTAVMNAGIESLRAKAPEFALAGPEQTEKELV